MLRIIRTSYAVGVFLLQIHILEFHQPLMAQKFAEPLRIELKPVMPAAGNSQPKHGLRAFLEIVPQQDGKPPAIQGSVLIVNNGSDTIALLDPKNSMFPELVTDDGWPVSIPGIGLETRIHRVPAPGESRPGVSAVIRLAVNEQHKIPIRISEILPIEKRPPSDPVVVGKEARNVPAAKPVPLPSGRYKIRVRLSLALAGVSTEEAAHTTTTLLSDWTDVVVGQL